MDGLSFLTDLEVMSMSDYDIIICMDWMYYHRVCLDYYAKMVIFQLLGIYSFVVSTSRGNTFIEAFFTHLEGEDGFDALGNMPIVSKFADVFEDILGLPPVRELEFINLLLGTRLIHRMLYFMALVQSDELKKQLDELLTQGLICKSHSLWGTSGLFMTKKDGSLYMCIDYQELNKVTIWNRYLLRRIEHLFDRSRGALWF